MAFTKTPDNFYSINIFDHSGDQITQLNDRQLQSVSWSRSVNSVDTCAFVLGQTDPIVREELIKPFYRIQLYRGNKLEWNGLFLKYSETAFDRAIFECFSYEICLDRFYSTEFVNITKEDIERAQGVTDITDPNYLPYVDESNPLRPTRWNDIRAHLVVRDMIENAVGIFADNAPNNRDDTNPSNRDYTPDYAGAQFRLLNPEFVISQNNSSISLENAWTVDYGFTSDDSIFGAIKKVAGTSEGAFDVTVDEATGKAVCNFFAPRPLYVDRTGDPSFELEQLVSVEGIDKIGDKVVLFPQMMSNQTWGRGFDFSNYAARILLHLPDPLESVDVESPWEYPFGVTVFKNRVTGEDDLEPNRRNETPRYDEYPKYSGAWIGNSENFRDGTRGRTGTHQDPLLPHMGVRHRQFHLKVDWTRAGGEYRSRKAVIEQAVNDNRRGVVYYNIQPTWKDDIRYSVEYNMGDRIKIKHTLESPEITVDVEKVTGKYERNTGEVLNITLVEVPGRFTFTAIE